MLALIPALAAAQDTEEEKNPQEQQLPISPQAAGLVRYGEYSVSPATGVPEISIPLYEVKLGEITLPVSISYHASGIKVDDVSSTVGLGWSLNAGGVITRNIVGAPDLMGCNNDYYDYDALSDLVNNRKTAGGILKDLVLGDGTEQPRNHTYDSGSDRYGYTIPGKSGAFRYSYKDKKFIPVNYSRMNIFVSGNDHDGWNSVFYIEDTDGTEYVFRQHEYTGVKSDENTTATSAWYLTEINTPNGTISINYQYAADYETCHAAEEIRTGYFARLLDGVADFNDESRLNTFRTTYLFRSPVVASVTWQGNAVSFEYKNDRSDLWATRLAKMTVINSQKDTVKTVDFCNGRNWGTATTSVSNNYRMMLDSIIVSDEGTYSFTYNEGFQFPVYPKFASGQTTIWANACTTDYWGYYNGRSSKIAVPKDVYSLVSSSYKLLSQHSYSSADLSDRSVVEKYAKGGIISTITYPTGGSSRFEFESNRINNDASLLLGGLRVKSIANTTGNATATRKFTYEGSTMCTDDPSKSMLHNTYYFQGYDGHCLPNQSYSKVATAISDPEQPLNSNKCVMYTKVTETFDNGESIEYTYDRYPRPAELCGYTALWQLATREYPYTHDFGYQEPILTGKRYLDSDGNAHRTESYEYTTCTFGNYNAGNNIRWLLFYGNIYNRYIEPLYDYDNFINDVTVPFDSISVHPFVTQLSKKTITDNATGVTSIEQYTYDSNSYTNKPKTVTVTNSDGKANTTEYLYPFDRPDNEICLMMSDEGCNDFVVGTRKYVDGQLMAETKTDYLAQALPSDSNLNFFYPKATSSHLSDEPFRERCRFSYTTGGNISGLVINECDSASLTWDTLEAHPLTYTLNGRQKNAYTWKPLAGVASITEENGYASHYRYDSASRLSSIADDRGTHQSFTYNYSNRPNSSSASNYIDTQTLLTADGAKAITSRRYADGLGRPTVLASDGVGEGGSAVYTMQEYDCKGRQVRSWLPVVGDVIMDASVNDMMSLAQAAYSDNHAYSSTSYNADDRPLTVTAPGDAWQATAKATEYVANGANDVKLYQAPMDGSYSLVKAGYYDASTLVGTRTTDEDGHASTIYKDLLGRTVLERRGTGNDTYFVYNDLGQLRFVLTPQYQNSGYKQRYAYEYRYDAYGRIIKKILPGCEAVQYGYDRADRLIKMHDAQLREKGKRRFFLYDSQGRIAIQGLCSATGSMSRTDNAYNVTYQGGTAGICGTGYVADSLSLGLEDVELELCNYYDGYEFAAADVYGTFPSFAATTVCTTGLKTGMVERASNGQYLHSIITYNNRGQAIKTLCENLDGDILESTQDYSFTDRPLATSLTLRNAVGEEFTATEEYGYYDKNDKLASATLSVTCGSSTKTQTIGTYHYDDLGRMSSIERGGMAGTVKYDYNLQGWLKKINTTDFVEEIFHEDNPLGDALYSGDISAIRWKAGDYQKTRGYRFTYDSLSRLTFAEYGENNDLSTNPNRFDEKVLEYDDNGNIERLQRRGLKRNGVYGKIDNLHIELYGNKLTSVKDDAEKLLYNGAMDFDGDSNCDSYYTYNDNGALTSDSGKGVAFIEYDDMGNPRRIQFTNGDVTEFVYSATGSKLRAVHHTAMPNIEVATGTVHELSSAETLTKDSTDYVGRLIKKNGQPDMYLFACGYCSLAQDTTAGGIVYHYYTQDHQGNNREVVSEDGTVEQITHYYPFGAPFTDYPSSYNAALQPYKYNGKELDVMHGLNTYDYGARQYDPVLCRWMWQDPLAEKYYNVSPYEYCGNNPINAVDPDGRDVIADKTSQNNILYTLTKSEQRFVRFDSNGLLDTRRINKSKSTSENMTALKTLANSDTNYIFAVSDNHFGVPFYEVGTNYDYPKNFSYGVARLPGAENNPSPDNNVYIFTASFLDMRIQVRNTAHEGYGHAYFYELSKTDPSVNPNHTKEIVRFDKEFDKEYNMELQIPVFGNTNISLENQILKVEQQALHNYEKNKK